jgi:hypothetical protein
MANIEYYFLSLAQYTYDHYKHMKPGQIILRQMLETCHTLLDNMQIHYDDGFALIFHLHGVIVQNLHVGK